MHDGPSYDVQHKEGCNGDEVNRADINEGVHGRNADDGDHDATFRESQGYELVVNVIIVRLEGIVAFTKAVKEHAYYV